MGRKESKAWDCIHSLCAANKMEEQNLYKRARLLLSSYSGLCWSRAAWDTLAKDPLSVEDAMCTHLAFQYLRDYSEDETKQEFITRVSNLMDVRVLQDIVNHTLMRVREFPVFGKIHFEILNKCYLSSIGYQEDDILFELDIERSRYYDRKKEAIMLFGIVFWASALPHYEELIKAVRSA